VWAPPELCTIPVVGSSADDSPAEVEVFDGDAEPVDVVEVDPDVVSVVVLVSDCSDDGFGDEESAGLDDSMSSAHASPGMPVVNPTPTPSATASAPTRPMNLEYP
jgi:hypothetical protein